MLLDTIREKSQKAKINSVSGLNIAQMSVVGKKSSSVKEESSKSSRAELYGKCSTYEIDYFTMYFLYVIIVRQNTSTL